MAVRECGARLLNIPVCRPSQDSFSKGITGPSGEGATEWSSEAGAWLCGLERQGPGGADCGTPGPLVLPTWEYSDPIRSGDSLISLPTTRPCSHCPGCLKRKRTLGC